MTSGASPGRIGTYAAAGPSGTDKRPRVVWRALLVQKAFLIVLDEFVFDRGSRFVCPGFQDVKPHVSLMEAVRAITDEGQKVIYLYIPPHAIEELTLAQMQAAGLFLGSMFVERSHCQVAVDSIAPSVTTAFEPARQLKFIPTN